MLPKPSSPSIKDPMYIYITDFTAKIQLLHVLMFFPHSSIGAESPATLVVATTLPSIVAVIAIILVVILLCAYIHLRVKLDKISKIAAGYNLEYATVEAHSTSIRTEENIAYETGMQSMDTKPNIAYATVMQGHSPRTQEHNTSL